MTIKGFITVRSSSTRLPNKCLLPLGNNNILQHVIKRCLKYGIDPIVCTSIDPSDDIIEEICKKMKIKFFRGSLINKLKRWSDCASFYEIKDFHTVDADDPFFDGDEMILSMKKLRDGNYDVVLPTISSSNGGASVGYSLTSKIVLEALGEKCTFRQIVDFLEENEHVIEMNGNLGVNYINDDTRYENDD